jgi:hypothetical protein
MAGLCHRTIPIPLQRLATVGYQTPPVKQIKSPDSWTADESKAPHMYRHKSPGYPEQFGDSRMLRTETSHVGTAGDMLKYMQSGKSKDMSKTKRKYHNWEPKYNRWTSSTMWSSRYAPSPDRSSETGSDPPRTQGRTCSYINFWESSSIQVSRDHWKCVLDTPSW